MSTTRKLAPWNALLWGSMLTMIGAVVYDRFVPQPKFDMTGKAIANQENRVRTQANALYVEFKETSKYASERLWTGDEKLIAPMAMSITTEVANRHQLKLAAFRPQKPVHEGTLVRFPFVVSLEGTYPQVISFIRELESPGKKLVVNIAQIASTDGASSAVNALVNVWAFQESKAVATKPKSTSSIRKSAPKNESQ